VSNRKTSTADRLVRQLTAFQDFAAMRQSMDSGYVPTILGRGDAAQKLVRILRAHGYRVFTGSNLSLSL
jgi:hypothetical protein